MRVHYHGGLAVAWSETDRREIDRALERLERGLFLDPEIDPSFGCLFWTVKHWIGSGQPPLLVLDWRTEDGEPLPLSFALVEQVKRQEGRADGAAERALAANERLKAQAQREVEDARDEIAADFERGSHYVVHRSPGLARTRAKMRAAGKSR